MPKRTLDHHAWLIDELRDPVVAANYLNEAMNDSIEMFLKALRNVAQARQMTEVAKRAGIRRESLYRTLSRRGNPCLDTLNSILDVVGLKILFQAQGISSVGAGSPRSQNVIHGEALPASPKIISARGSGGIPQGVSGSGTITIANTLTRTNNAASIVTLHQEGFGLHGVSASGSYSGASLTDMPTRIISHGVGSGIVSPVIGEGKREADYAVILQYGQQLTAPENPAHKLLTDQRIGEAT